MLSVTSDDAKEREALSEEHAAEFAISKLAPYGQIVLEEDGLRMQTPTEARIGRYFPSIPPNERDHFDYPMPLSDGFWRLYSEPVREFVSEAKRVTSAMDNIEKFLHGRYETEREKIEIGDAFDWLNHHLSSVHPFLTPLRAHELRDGLTCHSLIQTIARGIHLATLRQVAPRQCPACPKWFHSEDPRKLYCSRLCQERAKVNAYRARKKQAALESQVGPQLSTAKASASGIAKKGSK
jgi:hypothetical protein